MKIATTFLLTFYKKSFLAHWDYASKHLRGFFAFFRKPMSNNNNTAHARTLLFWEKKTTPLVKLHLPFHFLLSQTLVP